MRGWRRVDRRKRLSHMWGFLRGRGFVVEPEFAVATVAASAAAITQMVGAGVLGAINANFRGGLTANAAGEDGRFNGHG